MPTEWPPATAGRNRLREETSPYLLQHRDNPVHWWPWGPEALAEARLTSRPILLSVGYAACHWCHVMAHESFEDEATAALMNEHFVNIKVDREERPDVDAIYMSALHRLGEQGGWPLTMFLDTQARPFFGGTYFPPEAGYGRPSFQHVLREISRIWHDEPHKVRNNAESLSAMLAAEPQTGLSVRLDDDLLRGLASRLAEAVDGHHGGLRGAPKFPQWSIFWFLWRAAIRYDSDDARTAVLTTLSRICQGGIYDHLGGGFARYSVDERWLVPHFEKMLYDNALLIDLLTEAWRETRNPLYRDRVEETIAWLCREMTTGGGGFAASLDADSEGEEGRFYVWSYDEIMTTLGPGDADLFCNVYGVTEDGNFEGHSILNRLQTPDPLSPQQEDRLASLRARLLEARSARIRPGCDDKVLADWNGLMIASLVAAAQAFRRDDWLALARRAYGFVQEQMTVGGRLRHAWRSGRTNAPATATDYAAMIRAAIRLHAATCEASFLSDALTWTASLDRHYWHPSAGGYCLSADDTPDIIARLHSAADDATPNANALMISNLVHLSLLTGDSRHFERASRIPDAFASDLQRNLVAHTGMLACVFDLVAPQHVVIAGAPGEAATAALDDALRSLSLPGAIEQTACAVAEKVPVGGKPAAYLCLGTQCAPPVTDADDLHQQLQSLRRQRSITPAS